MRHSYQSQWHLFGDSPGTLTPGRYYFCPADTPFVAGFHHYGSRDWLDRNAGLEQDLGEDLTCPRPFDRGQAPAVLPDNILVGERTCLERGEPIAAALPQENIRDGFNRLCFLPQRPTINEWEILSCTASCSMQALYSWVLLRMYEHSPVPIQTLFTLLLGPRAVTTYFPGNTILPDVVTVVTPTGSACIIDGTQTFQQLALQAFQSIAPPMPVGGYSSLPLWYAASSWAHDCMLAAGADPARPVIVVGHSYGGAAAANLVARYSIGNPSREVRYLTFGTPKIGDSRMREIVSRCPGLALVNQQDWVGVLPPDNLLLWPVQAILMVAGLQVWTRWEPMPGVCMLLPSGNLLNAAYPQLDGPTLLNYAQRILAADLVPLIPDHSTSVYFARTIVRCPDAEWPVGELAWNYMLGLPPIARGGMMAGGKTAVPVFPVARGGMRLGGTDSPDLTPEARGGMMAGGASEPGQDHAARGGMRLGGTDSPDLTPEARGGMMAGGSDSPDLTPGAAGGMMAGGAS